MTHDVVELWHVITDEGESLLVKYTGYAPVNVWVSDTRIRPVEYRHLAKGCTDKCAGARPAPQQ